jgi:hypothetical protein
MTEISIEIRFQKEERREKYGVYDKNAATTCKDWKKSYICKEIQVLVRKRMKRVFT